MNNEKLLPNINKNSYEYYKTEGKFNIYFNKETGELLNLPIKLEDYDFVNKKAREHLKKMYDLDQARLKDKRGSFLRFPTKSNQDLVLSLTNRAFILFLALYIDYEKPLHKDGKPLRIKDIAELWKIYNKDGEKESLSLKKTSARLNELVNKNILIAIKDSEDGRYNNYFFNEYYLFQGASVGTIEFVKLYKSKLKDVIAKIKNKERTKNQNRKTKKEDIMKVIGLLHAVLPQVHPQTGYLVKNPEDKFVLQEGETINSAILKNPKLMKKLPKTLIAKSLGYKNMNTQTWETYFKYLADAGALKIDDTYGVKMYIMHPHLMYRQDSDAKDHLLEIEGKFDLHKNQIKDEDNN